MIQQTFQIKGHIIEELLGMSSKTIGLPLWLSGNRKRCPNCEFVVVPKEHRETNC